MKAKTQGPDILFTLRWDHNRKWELEIGLNWVNVIICRFTIRSLLIIDDDVEQNLLFSYMECKQKTVYKNTWW